MTSVSNSQKSKTTCKKLSVANPSACLPVPAVLKKRARTAKPTNARTYKKKVTVLAPEILVEKPCDAIKQIDPSLNSWEPEFVDMLDEKDDFPIDVLHLLGYAHPMQSHFQIFDIKDCYIVNH